MSVTTWVNDLINTKIDFSEIELQELKKRTKDLWEFMDKIFKGKSLAERRTRPFKSVIARETLEKYRWAHPEDFYSFEWENISTFVFQWTKNGQYGVATRGLRKFTAKELEKLTYKQNLWHKNEVIEGDESGEFWKYGGFERIEAAIELWKVITHEILTRGLSIV